MQVSLFSHPPVSEFPWLTFVPGFVPNVMAGNWVTEDIDGVFGVDIEWFRVRYIQAFKIQHPGFMLALELKSRILLLTLESRTIEAVEWADIGIPRDYPDDPIRGPQYVLPSLFLL